MNDAVSISLTEEEKRFIDGEIAAGKYADDVEMLHAGLAALERQQRMQTLRASIAEGDAVIAQGNPRMFETAEELNHHILTRAEDLRRELAIAETSGESNRQVPEIMNAVKTKLRANGTL